MEKKTITTDRCIRISDERAALEGRMAPPYEGAELSAVLDICGCAEILSAAAEAERVFVSGRARYTVVYLARNGIIDSFDSECGFEHAIPAEAVTAGMNVCIHGEVLGTTWRVENGAIEVRSELSLCGTATMPVEHEILVADGNEEIQYDVQKAETIACSQRSIKAYVSHDLRIPQNLPEAKKIFSVGGHAALSEIRRDIDRIIVEGEVHLCVLYESADKNAPLQVFYETVPFGEMIRDASCGEDPVIFAQVSLDRLGGELTAGDTMEISGVVSVSSLCIDRREQEFVRDLYALNGEARAEEEMISVAYPILLDAQRKTLRLDAQIPESAPEAARILHVSCRPEITGVVSGPRLSLDGILHTTLIYTTAESGIKSVHLRLPFETEAGQAEDVAEVEAFCDHAQAQGSGREIDLKLGLRLLLRGKKDEEICAVTAAAVEERTEELPAGLLVYFADEGEKLWDICKRCGVPAGCAMPLDSPEPLHRGDRVMVMR